MNTILIRMTFRFVENLYGSLTCQRKKNSLLEKPLVVSIDYFERFVERAIEPLQTVIAYYCDDAFRPTNPIPEYMYVDIELRSRHSYIIISGSKATIIHVMRILHTLLNTIPPNNEHY